ncbi:MAG: tRNA pseudouridine(38-40) synthase TruA [Anaerolineae bacterium]|nr:tRNA pseudouridine(38-40) synthase TruA [Anaerolineae bacterium]
MRVKAIVAYDGTGYGGFQRQTNAPSIQAELEHSLAHILDTPTRILAAGRTDAGVHAEGLVIAFDIAWPASRLRELHHGINALLPEQISVLGMTEVSPEFHPRYDALSRRYRYTIYRAPIRNPLTSRYSLHIRRPLSVTAMQEAATALLGRHDFFAFGSPPQGDNSVRVVTLANWEAKDEWLLFDIEGNAFLYRMVRLVVGTLLRVGYGALTPVQFKDILETKDRRKAGPAVAAKGLCLKAVTYRS